MVIVETPYKRCEVNRLLHSLHYYQCNQECNRHEAASLPYRIRKRYHLPDHRLLAVVQLYEHDYVRVFIALLAYPLLKIVAIDPSLDITSKGGRSEKFRIVKLHIVLANFHVLAVTVVRD